MSGKVYLVGAGPGDPELLTLKAVACIRKADLILYDYLIDDRALLYAKAGAELVPLDDSSGESQVEQTEINRRMIDGAMAGQTVVRLKGGDPHIFGKLNDEIKALSFEAGIEFEIVPGITSAFAAAQAAGISLTDRHYTDSWALAFISGLRSRDPSLPKPDFKQFSTFPGTLVFYMGMCSAEVWSRELLDGGKSVETPVLFVCNATLPNQRVVRTTLGKVKEAVGAVNTESTCAGNCIVIVGQTVRINHPIDF
ncbi:hypothetical protein FACS1894170_06550 [Planctomycetales bacterium]|nr:hypothetical protein FACS1894170_06550 [Planctomycetales bacterium]